MDAYCSAYNQILIYLFQIFGCDITKYPNVSKWLAKMKKTIPKYEELNHAGCLQYKEIYDSRTKNK